MSRKTSPARIAAFLKTLSETGNQTLACEAAKVSRSWLTLHRSTDPAFDAAVRAAIEAAKAALSDAAARKPRSGWGAIGGEELVVKGTGGAPLADGQVFGRRVQIARARLKQWTPAGEDRFLATLAATCNVRLACAAVGLTPASAYQHRTRWPAFAARWDAAVDAGSASLEAALLEAGANLFSTPDGRAPEGGGDPPAITGMDAAQALHLLYMHKHYVPRAGRTPGRPPGRATEAQAAASIERLLARLARRKAKRGRGR